VSDSVVVWRAWVLFRLQKRFLIVPLAFLLATIAMIFACLFLTFEHYAFVNSVYAPLYGAALTLSLATNAIVTVMFSYKLWSHRRFMSGLALRRRQPSKGQRIISVIIESGVVYCATQLFIIISEFAQIHRGYHPDMFGLKIITGILWSFTGMYPTVVMVLINQKVTMGETYPYLSSMLGTGT